MLVHATCLARVAQVGRVCFAHHAKTEHLGTRRRAQGGWGPACDDLAQLKTEKPKGRPGLTTTVERGHHGQVWDALGSFFRGVRREDGEEQEYLHPLCMLLYLRQSS